jgi:hypothetical protein
LGDGKAGDASDVAIRSVTLPLCRPARASSPLDRRSWTIAIPQRIARAARRAATIAFDSCRTAVPRNAR